MRTVRQSCSGASFILKGHFVYSLWRIIKLFICLFQLAEILLFITHTLTWVYLLFCCSLGGWNNLLNQWNSEAEWAISALTGIGVTAETKMSRFKNKTKHHNTIKCLMCWVLGHSKPSEHLQCVLAQILHISGLWETVFPQDIHSVVFFNDGGEERQDVTPKSPI